jgi:antitoxin component of MazEF toxin-antitoxin module
MTMLIKIGNSQSIRIPKFLIQQADLENTLLIKPIDNIQR